MKFKVVLWYMARRMEMLSRTHAGFIARLHGRDFVLQISTDEGAHRFFHIHHNRVFSRSGIHESPSVALLFKTDDLAFRLLSKADANAFMQAMQHGELKVIGDYSLLMWLMGVGKYLQPPRPRRRRAVAAAG